MATALLFSAAFQALYGLIVVASGYDRIWHVEKTVFLDAATGTWVNRNHFADYLAMALPCLTQKIDPQGEMFQAALAGAKLVGGAQPHLRVVDPSPLEGPWGAPEDIPEEALGLAGLATEASQQGVIMSMENSSLPIRNMAMLVEEVRGMVSESAGQGLGLCPDPTNQLRRFPDSDPLAELDALPLEMIKIVHFKQIVGGESLPSVTDGDLDCHKMRDILDAKGYAGPAIMEIPSDAAVFDNLESSFKYLDR